MSAIPTYGKITEPARVAAEALAALPAGRLLYSGSSVPLSSSALAWTGSRLSVFGNYNGTTQAPSATPMTIASVSAGGAVNDGTHFYKVSFVTAEGETEVSIYTANATTGGGNNTVNLSGIPTGGATVTARKLYRALTNAAHDNAYTPVYLVATISDNTTTTYADAAADSALTTIGPRDNTTGGVFYQNGASYAYSGTYNTAYGQSAGNLAGGGIGNSAFGSQTLKECTTGYNNQGFGNGTLYHCETGYFNCGFGSDVLFALVDGHDNSGYGVDALHLNVSGNHNTAVGVRCLNKNLASDNTGIGWEALKNNTSGSDNFAGGQQALLSNTTGYWNVAVGTGTLGQNQSGIMNTGLGLFAGALSTGSSNVFLGGYAGATTTGNASVMVGAHAGRYETAGNAFYINNVNQTNIAGDKAYSLMYGTFSGTAGSLTGQQLTINGKLTVNGLVVLTSATLLVTPVAGTIEYDGTHFYGTNGAGTRLQLDNA